MNYKEKLIELYDKVGGVSAARIETFRNVAEPFSEDWVENIIEDLDNMSDWEYDIYDVRNVVAFEHHIQSLFESKFQRLEQMIDELKSPKHQEKLKSQIDEILEAIECCYITLGSNYAEYGERYYKLTEE